MKAAYPLSEKAPHLLKTPSGIPFAEITLDAVADGRVTMDDLRIAPEALELQAQVAEAAGRPQLAENLRRAAELAPLPEALILSVYEALRPGRATREELLRLADSLEREHQAPRSAALVREAAESV